MLNMQQQFNLIFGNFDYLQLVLVLEVIISHIGIPHMHVCAGDVSIRRGIWVSSWIKDLRIVETSCPFLFSLFTCCVAWLC